MAFLRRRKQTASKSGPIPTSIDAPSVKQRRKKPRMKKIRFAIVLVGLLALGLASTVFGMMMAVSQDLPALESFSQYRASKNSVVFDSQGERIGALTSNENKILVESADISPNIKNAVVSIEDARFYEHRGVDFQGIGRALVQDVLSQSAKQGASTITQQFVKTALETQSNRTVFEKLREAALAYHLERRWSKDRILTAYLNTVYYGQGAYGIEAAARTYFGVAHPTCGTSTEPCASVLSPAEAAVLAGVIQSPSSYDVKNDPDLVLDRRNRVLQNMTDQGYISEEQFNEAVATPLPSANDIQPPTLDSKAPFFTSWLRQQLVDKFGPGRAFFGGYRVKSTLDLELQDSAQNVVSSYLGGIAPTSAVVVIDNANGGVKTMVAGSDFDASQFNLATQGYRQPGSSIKPFTLVTALEQGISPESVYTSAPKEFPVPGTKGKEVFPVSNYGDSYNGAISLSTATTLSDNSVYAEVGLQVGTKNIAKTIHKMGYNGAISTNPAMTLGGLKQGVTPLRWAYAYSTLANTGSRVTGTLASDYERDKEGPVAYTKVTDQNDKTVADNHIIHDQVIPEEVATTAKGILHTVVTSGTGKKADIGDPLEFGKTGTTENNGDAWFCGAIEAVTACVWVGHADTNTPMETEYGGAPVDGGTFPALIWNGVISSYLEIEAARAAGQESATTGSTDGTSTYVAPETSSAAPSTDTAAPETATPEPAAPATPEPAAPAAPASPAPAAPAAPSNGGGIGGGGGISPRR